MVNFLDRQKGAVAALVVFFAAFVGFLFAVNYKLVLPLADTFSQKPLYEAYLRMSPNASRYASLGRGRSARSATTFRTVHVPAVA
jgi:hypothetical protein